MTFFDIKKPFERYESVSQTRRKDIVTYLSINLSQSFCRIQWRYYSFGVETRVDEFDETRVKTGKFYRLRNHSNPGFAVVFIYTLCLKKTRTPATFYNNSNSPGSIAIDLKIIVRKSALNSMCYFARNFKNRVPAEVFLWHQQ